MSSIWVLGAGQLGAMLKQAANPLGLDVRPVDIETDETLPLKADDIVTAEREDWPETADGDQSYENPARCRLCAQQTHQELGVLSIDPRGGCKLP